MWACQISKKILFLHDLQELKRLKDSLGRLRRVFAPDRDRTETRRVASHERLGEVLKILRQMLEKYPVLQSNEIVGSAEHLIQQVPLIFLLGFHTDFFFASTSLIPGSYTVRYPTVTPIIRHRHHPISSASFNLKGCNLVCETTDGQNLLSPKTSD